MLEVFESNTKQPWREIAAVVSKLRRRPEIGRAGTCGTSQVDSRCPRCDIVPECGHGARGAASSNLTTSSA
jgi:hypothetical protein